MLELTRSLSGHDPDMSDARDTASSGVAQHDLHLRTIDFLEQEVLRLEQQLLQAQHLACHDELTGLPTRSLLRDRLNQAIIQAARHHKQVGLLFMDLNCFKCVNDTYGHNIGDALLVQVAKRLISCIRAADSAYRYSGDEFVILLPEVDGARGSTELKWKLQALFAKPYHIGRLRLVVTASIGIAVFPTDGLTHHDLLRCADGAMYQAKANSNSLSRDA